MLSTIALGPVETIDAVDSLNLMTGDASREEYTYFIVSGAKMYIHSNPQCSVGLKSQTSSKLPLTEQPCLLY